MAKRAKGGCGLVLAAMCLPAVCLAGSIHGKVMLAGAPPALRIFSPFSESKPLSGVLVEYQLL